VKLLAIPVGLVGTVVSLMAGVGVITTNIFVRGIVGFVLALGLPLAIADKLLPKDDPTSGKGIVTDVLAVFLLAVPLGLTAASRYTARVYVAEGDRLSQDGYGVLSEVAYFLGNVRPERPAVATNVPVENPDAGTDAGNSADAAANGSLAATADAAGEVPDAGSADAAEEAGAVKEPKPQPTGEKTPAELFREWSPSVVTIMVKKGDAQGGGTGFLIDEYGTIVTNHHVIDGAEQARIKFSNGATYENIDVLVDERAVDLAYLLIEL